MANRKASGKPWPKAIVAAEAASKNLATNDVCCMCLKEIAIQIFKGTGVCSENCRKDRDNDHLPARTAF